MYSQIRLVHPDHDAPADQRSPVSEARMAMCIYTCTCMNYMRLQLLVSLTQASRQVATPERHRHQWMQVQQVKSQETRP